MLSIYLTVSIGCTYDLGEITLTVTLASKGSMGRDCTEFEKIEARRRALNIWLTENAPACRSEQKHLEEGSQERAYWHYGYMVALRDVMQFLAGDNATSPNNRKLGICDSSPAA
jgi:hypothetical protein